MTVRFTAVFATYLLAATAGVASPVRAETPSGGVYVTTLPAGANVWVDGTFVGRAPVLVDALVPGNHVLTIAKSGWTAQEVDIPVAAREITMSSTRLVLSAGDDPSIGSGSVLVRGTPPGAVLTLDGSGPAFPDRSVKLPAGEHQLTVTTSHGRTTRKFTVLADTTTQVVFAEPRPGEAHPAVVAPAEDYLPTNSFSLEGTKVVVRYAGHVVVAHLGETAMRMDGESVAFDSSPQAIGGKLYLPLVLLQKLSGDTSKDR